VFINRIDFLHTPAILQCPYLTFRYSGIPPKA